MTKRSTAKTNPFILKFLMSGLGFAIPSELGLPRGKKIEEGIGEPMALKKSTLLKTALLPLLLTSSLQALAGVRPINEVFSPAEPADPSQFMKVAVIQWNPERSAPLGVPQAEVDQYLESNREEMAKRIELAVQNKAEFIVLSEFVVEGYPEIPGMPEEEQDYRNRQDVAPFVEPIPGKSTNFFANIAKKNHVWIQFGMAEVTSANEYFNTAVVLNEEGEIVAQFHKNSLYELENNFLSAGTEAITFQSPFGKVGLVICADIYDDQLLAKYKSMGVDVLSLSTSWAHFNTGMSTFQGAAKENEMVVLAANQTYFPDSGVINSDGTIQSHIRQSGDAIAYGFLPLKK
jgi:predicted amidohydrolase